MITATTPVMTTVTAGTSALMPALLAWAAEKCMGTNTVPGLCAALTRTLGVADRVGVVRVLRQAGQHGRFGQRFRK